MEWFYYFILYCVVFRKVSGVADDSDIKLELDCIRDHAVDMPECAIWSGHEKDQFDYCVFRPRLWPNKPKICGIKYTWLIDSVCTGGAKIIYHETDICSMKAQEYMITGTEQLDYVNVSPKWDAIKYKIRRSYICCDDYPNRICCDATLTGTFIYASILHPFECTGERRDIHFDCILIGGNYVRACSFSLVKPRRWCNVTVHYKEACKGQADMEKDGKKAQIRVYRDGQFLVDICTESLGQKLTWDFGRWDIEISLIYILDFKLEVKYHCDPPPLPKLPRILCNKDIQHTIIKDDAILADAGHADEKSCTYALEQPKPTCTAVEIVPKSNLTKVCEGKGTNQNARIKLTTSVSTFEVDLCEPFETTWNFEGNPARIYIHLENFWEYYIQIHFVC